ncbi:GNAT family N-acetyltransferase [Caldanaerobacter sp.]|uniref:GNAT family N-acetyltransferase n=1 Tax=Caldanaerobacter sp. TaxID=2930036 RepID=UPI003C710F4A
MFRIRFAKREDFPEIERIAKKCGISSKLNFLDEIFMIAEDTLPFGFISMKVEDTTAYITNFVLLPTHKDENMENLMIRVMLNHALDMGLEKAAVGLKEWEEFFLKIGFGREGDLQVVNLKKFFKE